MAGIVLSHNESIRFQLSGVYEANSFVANQFDLTLTNKRIIVTKVSMFGKQKIVIERPITDIRIYDNKAQVKLYTIGGSQTKIDIFLSSGQLSYKVNGAANTELIRFANEINHILSGTEEDIYSVQGNEKGIKAFFKAFLGENSSEVKMAFNQKITIKCKNCGATFESIKSQTVKCPYCGSLYDT